MKCIRCGSENTNIYEAYEPEKHIEAHSCLWWFFIGWWWWIICFMLGIIGIIIAFITTFYTKETMTKHKYCYCRDCGYETEILNMDES